MELLALWRVVWRRKWIIIQAFAVIFLVIMMGTFALPSVYETKAKLLLKNSNAELALFAQLGLAPSTFPAKEEPETETGVNMLASTPYLKKVISRLKLENRKGEELTPKEFLKSSFLTYSIFPKPHVSMKAIEDTPLIEITAKSCDPEETAAIANTVAQVYIQETLEERKQEVRDARRIVEEQCQRTKDEHIALMKELEIYRASSESFDLARETDAAIDKMADLITQKELNISEIGATTAKLETVKRQLERESATSLSSVAISESVQLETLKKELSNLQLQLEGMLTEKTPNHPAVVVLNRQIDNVKKEIDKEVIILQESGRDLQTIAQVLAELHAHGKSIDDNLEQQKAVLNAIPRKQTEMSVLQSKCSAMLVVYKALLTRLDDLWTVESMIPAHARLVEPATKPDPEKPKSPNKVVNAVLGIFLGALFGFGLGFMVEYLDDTICSAEDVKEQGMVFLGSARKVKWRSPLVLEKDPREFMSESYRTIRNAIKRSSAEKPLKSILIASVFPKEGRSTAAVNLAVAFAREGKETLIVDANVRSPSVHTLCRESSNSVGLTSVLAGESDESDAIRKTKVEGLSLLTSGPLPADPGRLVDSSKFQTLMEDLSARYDVVVVDSPPVLTSNDAAVLAEYVDGVVFVIECERVPRKTLAAVREHFGCANTVGAILTKVKDRRFLPTIRRIHNFQHH